MDKNTLIHMITPLYNLYKGNKYRLKPIESLEIMWDIGSSLEEYLKTNKIRPHALYREIYGKSEGSKNIIQKSYISREFLNRCFRIWNIFVDKEQIKRDFQNLQSFTAFREAMPFLDNPKYAFKGEEKQNLINLLNSNLKKSALLKRIRELQLQKINIKNPRTQRLSDLEGIKQNFITFYNYIYNLINLKDYEVALNKANNITIEIIRDFAKTTASLCQEGLKFVKFEVPVDLDPIWKNFYKDVIYLMEQNNPKERRRFRRLMRTIVKCWLLEFWPNRFFRNIPSIFCPLNASILNDLSLKQLPALPVFAQPLFRLQI